MGTHNIGNQTITWQYHLIATGESFGKRNLGIVPTGIYSGGYLTRVSNSEVTLSTFVVEIKDDTNQVSVRSTTVATLNAGTLDSGDISSATPYLVMRWVYAPSAANYLEIQAIASVGAAQDNDLIIGKCDFTAGPLNPIFDYTCRTFPNIQSLFLKVEESETSEMFVRLRGGRIHIGTGYVVVPDKKIEFTAPIAPNSRIDVIYIDSAGSPQILPGAPAVSPVAPKYQGKLALAEVYLVNGDGSIPANRITDVRASLSPYIIPDSNSLQYNSTSGKLEIKTPFYGVSYNSGWFAITKNMSYTKTHDLGSQMLLLQIYFAPDLGGSPDLTKMTPIVGHNDSNVDDRWIVSDTGFIYNVTSTQMKITTGHEHVAVIPTGSNGAVTVYNSGWYCVIAIKVA